MSQNSPTLLPSRETVPVPHVSFAFYLHSHTKLMSIAYFPAYKGTNKKLLKQTSPLRICFFMPTYFMFPTWEQNFSNEPISFCRANKKNEPTTLASSFFCYFIVQRRITLQPPFGH